MRSRHPGAPVAVSALAAVLLAGCGARTEGGEGEGAAVQGSGDDLLPADDPGGGEEVGTGGRAGPGSGGRLPMSTGGRPGRGSGGSPSAGGSVSTPAGCAWGNTVICRCTEAIYGAMDCLPDRSGYGPCRCGSVMPPPGRK